MSRAVDTYMAYKFVKGLTTPWRKTKAYKMGLIDANGKKLKSPETAQEKNAYTFFDRLVFNIKRIINKAPGGKSQIASYGSALLLLKETYKDQLEDPDMFEKLLDRYINEADGWIAIYNGKKLEIKKGKDANDLYSAKQFALKKLKVPKSKKGLMAIKPAYNEETGPTNVASQVPKKDMPIGKKKKKKEDEDDMDEAMTGGEERYKAFVNKKLKKYGVSSPDELDKEEKKKFFDEIDKEWDAKNEGWTKDHSDSDRYLDPNFISIIRQRYRDETDDRVATDPGAEVDYENDDMEYEDDEMEDEYEDDEMDEECECENDCSECPNNESCGRVHYADDDMDEASKDMASLKSALRKRAGKNINLKSKYIDSETYQKAKKLSSFNPKEWKWDKKSKLYVKEGVDEGKTFKKVVRNKKIIRKAVCTGDNQHLEGGRCVPNDAKFKRKIRVSVKKRKRTLRGKSTKQKERKRKISLRKIKR